MKHKPLLWMLFALVALAVIPYGWIAEHVPAVDLIISSLFASEFAHAVGHMLIFFTIGTALLLAMPKLRQHPIRYLLLILVIALIQEGLQLSFKNRGIVLNDITDIGTDLVAAGLAFALYRIKTTMQGSAATSYRSPLHNTEQ